jgi:hypothetical protein
MAAAACRHCASAWRRLFLPQPIGSLAIAQPTPRRQSARPYARRDALSTCLGPIRRRVFRRHHLC